MMKDVFFTLIKQVFFNQNYKWFLQRWFTQNWKFGIILVWKWSEGDLKANPVCSSQPWVLCCTVSGWVCCWTTLIQMPSTSSTASPSCSRPPHPCCSFLRPCSAARGPKSGRTTWRPGTASLTRVTWHWLHRMKSMLVFMARNTSGSDILTAEFFA